VKSGNTNWLAWTEEGDLLIPIYKSRNILSWGILAMFVTLRYGNGKDDDIQCIESTTKPPHEANMASIPHERIFLD
jgi:hypothetical protein